MDTKEYTFPDEAETGSEVENDNEVDTTTSFNVTNTELSAQVGDNEEDEVQVEIVDDTPPKDRGRKPSEPPAEVTEEELENYSEKVRKRLEHFSKGYHDERRAKEAAERQRQELERITQHLVEENKRLKGTVTKSQEELLSHAKRVAEGELAWAKSRYKQAYESGDADQMVEATAMLQKYNDKFEKLQNFEVPALQEEDNEVQVYKPAPAPAVDNRAAEWAKRNPWFGSDDEMTSYALGLHNKLVKQNVDPTSDEYYEAINSRMRQLFPERFEDDEEADYEPAAKPRRKANVVAPATRTTAPKKIRLTQVQVAYAKKYGIPLDVYAREVAKLKRTQNG